MAEFRHILRIANTDLPGPKHVALGLTKIKGIGRNMAIAICQVAGVDRKKKVGDLTDAEAKKLDEVVRNPTGAGIPTWMLNRQKDYETGEDKHLILADIDFTLDQDKKREMRMRSYKGVRYPARLTVRGQRTKSNFRLNKGKVTIKKKVNVIRK